MEKNIAVLNELTQSRTYLSNMSPMNIMMIFDITIVAGNILGIQGINKVI